MPTYEYQCQKCHHRHEAFQAITAKPLTKCPRCAGRLKRLMGSGSGFLFKGSGFYITDYRSKGYQDAKKREEQSKPSPSSTKTPASSSSIPRAPSGSSPESFGSATSRSGRNPERQSKDERTK